MNKREKYRLVKDTFFTLIALFIGLVIIFPAIYCVAAAFKSRSELSVFPPRLLPNNFLNMDNFRAVFRMAPFTRFI